MNARSRIMLVLSLVLVAAFVLSACQPVTTTVTVVETVEVPVDREVEVIKTQEVTVIETQVVEVEVEREAFTAPHPILGDLKVRQAIAYCTNKLEMIQSVYPLISPEQQAGLVMNTFIPPNSWAYAGDENVTVYEFDPAKGQALLDEAGWALDEASGLRLNEAGEALSLKFTTTNAAFRQTWAAVFEQQMAACGIQIVRLHAPASWWFGDQTGLARRDFEMGAFAWVGQADPGGETLWACDQIPFPSNGWAGQNYMGWCNEKASVGIKNANNTLVKDERIAWFMDVQQAYTEDVPAIPLFNRTETFSTRADLVGFAPTPGEEYYLYNIGEWEVPGQDTIVVGFTQEPASLYSFVESAFVAALPNMAIGNQRSWTSLNYDFQPVYIKSLPTIENGGTLNNDVEVKEGDMVYDASGNVIALAAGVEVRNAAGEVVEFTSGTVTMKQLVMTFEYLDNLAWPDGSPVTQEDIELWVNVQCDRESGATSFILCDKTQGWEFDGLKVTRTMLPGVQDPLYFTYDPGFAPANRVLSDGRLLKDVPAKDWPTLPEISETPWGVGPYMVTEWVKGEKLVLAAHPYWFGGAPKTPNVVISFVTPENAEAQLLGGTIDMLGSETLTDLTPSLVEAETAGDLKNYIIAGATWEHIDFLLFAK
jgi:ABC-type transport system substrate-binding protein